MRWVANSGRHVPDTATKTPKCDQTAKGRSYKQQLGRKIKALGIHVLYLSSGDV